MHRAELVNKLHAFDEAIDKLDDQIASLEHERAIIRRHWEKRYAEYRTMSPGCDCLLLGVVCKGHETQDKEK